MEFVLAALLGIGIDTNTAMNGKEELLKFRAECLKMQTCTIVDRGGYDQIVMNGNEPVDRFACITAKSCTAKWVDGHWATYPIKE